VAEYRHLLVERVAETDEALLEKYLGGEELTPEEIKAAVRKMVIAGEIYPVLCGSAFKNKGVQPMLDAVVDFLPSPLDIPAAEGIDNKGNPVERKADEAGPFAALAFKIVADRFGKLTYFRVYSGTIAKGDEVYNATKERKERLGRILLMHANQREDLEVAMAGDIVAGLGFQQTTTGDTLCDRAHPVVLEETLRHAAETGRPALVEATCNQVNQEGGYTGTRPAEFVAFVSRLAREAGMPEDRVVLGGDHLGPNPWTALGVRLAMARAAEMVRDYVRAGYAKVHLDASMRCADSCRSGSVSTSVPSRSKTARMVFVVGRRGPPTQRESLACKARAPVLTLPRRSQRT